MSLRIWLPLNGDLKNLGTDQSIVPSIMGTGITYSSGKIGQAATFPNNSNSCIHMPGLKLQIFSWTAWFKVSGEGSSSSQRFMSEGRDCGSVGTNLWVSKAGTTLSWSTHMKSGSTSILLNTWYHVGLIANGSNIKLYLNGELKSTTAYTEDSDYAQSNDKLVLGKMAYYYTNTGSYFPFNGQLNDVRVYDHALSEKEIKKISQGLILHYALNRSGFGQENLMKNSSRKLDNAGYYVGTYAFANPSELVTGEKYTFSFSGELQDPSQTGWYFNIFPSPYPTIGTVSTTEEGRYSFTFTMPENGGNRTSIGCYSTPLGNYKGCAIWNVKLEKGEKATPWCPNSADTEYTTLRLNDNIEYDLSGYNRNAVRTNGVTYNFDSPKYNVSSVFNGASTSYIKCDSTDWMVPMTELTISCWCYMDNWTQFSSYGRLWSCTEGGGFGVYWENNQMEFPISASPRGYLPTIARCGVTLTDLTSGWHMFTFIYTTIGTKVYIDGNLYKSYEINSDYVTYNTGVKLFLGCEAAGSSLPTSPYFKGKMSDFRIYATALSQADIAELYSIHRS